MQDLIFNLRGSLSVSFIVLFGSIDDLPEEQWQRYVSEILAFCGRLLTRMQTVEVPLDGIPSIANCLYRRIVELGGTWQHSYVIAVSGSNISLNSIKYAQRSTNFPVLLGP